MSDVDPALEARKERAWAEVAAINAAFDRGEITEEGWHQAMMALVVPAYLAADNPRAQSGHSGNEARWQAARRPILTAVNRSGTFLDVGCANGFLMECVHAWAAEMGLALEPYGLDIAPELVALARQRLPHWADRLFVGNALGWQPPRRFDFVRTGLEYVPPVRRPALIAHLLRHVVQPGGRLIIGVFSEEADRPDTEEAVRQWGFPVAGRLAVPHPDDARLARRVFWLDAAR